MAARRPKLSISLDSEVVKRVDRLAKQAGQNRSRMLEQLVVASLEGTENTIKMATDPVVMGALARAMGEPGVIRGLAEAVRADLSDEQLRLFTKAVEHVAGKKGRR